MKKAEFIESMKVLILQPGDIIICKVPMALSEKEREQLNNSLKETFAALGYAHQKIIVLEQGIDIGVLRHDEKT